MELWTVQHDAFPVRGAQAVELIRKGLSGDRLETWFESDRGRLLAVVTNRQRAMILLLNEIGDAGEHAIDPGAEGESSGYVLGNGQDDTYSDSDTVRLEVGLVVVASIVDSGNPPRDAPWKSDR